MNELQTLVAKGRQLSRRGFYGRIHDACSSQELILAQELPYAAMAAAIPNSKENVNPQQPVTHVNLDSDLTRFMKDVKSELGSLRTAVLKMEAILTRLDTIQPPKEISKKEHAALANQINETGKKGSNYEPILLPTNYLSSDDSDQEESGVSYYARGAIRIPIFTYVGKASRRSLDRGDVLATSVVSRMHEMEYDCNSEDLEEQEDDSQAGSPSSTQEAATPGRSTRTRQATRVAAYNIPNPILPPSEEDTDGHVDRAKIALPATIVLRSCRSLQGLPPRLLAKASPNRRWTPRHCQLRSGQCAP